jgi:hypothetical protein
MSFARNGNENGSKPIGLDKHKLNTPSREPFSGKALSMWLVVTRKRLPPPFAMHATKANPTLIVLPVANLQRRLSPCRSK